ncbi:conserved protein of unknown function [Petrocella atlantisensis]|uniref:Uncharacterized protein n=1 Tax=Petrocella atlantisensis TaxID=2173034 RepID=A0A3P7NXX7_9FIRM|nr:hypothetical protein [Petrocella atlantisensis]MCF8018772.1 hypothetical protein [Vallitaleaceae bacterium]VDN46140.1 conserved protein of unknown function [Petrocella atlantisensis]
MVKKIIIGLGLCVIIGFSIPFVMSNQKPGQDIDVEDLKKQFEQELERMQEQKLRETYETMWDEHMDKNPQELEDLLNEIEQLNDHDIDADPDISEKDEDTLEPITDVTVSHAEDTSTTLPDEEVDIMDVTLIPLSDGEAITEQVVKDQWVNQKIITHKDQISDSDLSTGAGIYNQLDTNYLFGIAEGGLSVEEEEEVKAYLRANLSEAELGTAIELYYKYVHLLN